MEIKENINEMGFFSTCVVIGKKEYWIQACIQKQGESLSFESMIDGICGDVNAPFFSLFVEYSDGHEVGWSILKDQYKKERE